MYRWRGWRDRKHDCGRARPPKAGRGEWVGLAVIALPCLLYSLDLTVLYLAVPSLTADLDPSSTELLWITDKQVDEDDDR